MAIDYHQKKKNGKEKVEEQANKHKNKVRGGNLTKKYCYLQMYMKTFHFTCSNMLIH